MWIDYFETTFEWLFNTLKLVFKTTPETDSQINNIKKYLQYIYHDRFVSKAPNKVSATFDYDIIEWLNKDAKQPLNKIKNTVTYNFLKTSVSDVDALTIWQDFGFKLDKKQTSKPIGYQNKLFIRQLRRDVEKLSI